MVARQIRASGGQWWRFGDTQIHVDPGPGALVRALSHVPPCEPARLDGIILSHKHLDHACDVNVMIEAMSQGGWRPKGTLLAPRDAFEGAHVVLPYTHRFVKQIEHLSEELDAQRKKYLDLVEQKSAVQQADSEHSAALSCLANRPHANQPSQR